MFKLRTTFVRNLVMDVVFADSDVELREGTKISTFQSRLAQR